MKGVNMPGFTAEKALNDDANIYRGVCKGRDNDDVIMAEDSDVNCSELRAACIAVADPPRIGKCRRLLKVLNCK